MWLSRVRGWREHDRKYAENTRKCNSKDLSISSIFRNEHPPTATDFRRGRSGWPRYGHRSPGITGLAGGIP